MTRLYIEYEELILVGVVLALAAACMADQSATSARHETNELRRELAEAGVTDPDGYEPEEEGEEE